MSIKKINHGFIFPSAAFTLKKSQINFYNSDLELKAPEIGDVVYGSISYIGQHSTLENTEGRIHLVNDGTKSVFVFGNRYAPDYYEGLVPSAISQDMHLLSRSGMIGKVIHKNDKVKDPTKIKIYGYICDKDGNVLNTRNFTKIKIIEPPEDLIIDKEKRSKLIIVVGTSMNSGKSMTCAMCCWALSSMGHNVRASKITGTASLKDILLMSDNGASPVCDFTHFGFPSTYMLDQKELFSIFHSIDMKYANNPKNYWVVEIADGILQRETSMLLGDTRVTNRAHKIVLSASDAFGAIGGIRILNERFGINPDFVSGVCSGSPLGIRELNNEVNIPVINNMIKNLNNISGFLI